MIILPATDIIGGKVVRLSQGDYGKVQTYGDDPVGTARGFELAGATWLHAVDLDGAKQGAPANFEVICRIISSTGLSVEVGGGIRTLQTVKEYIQAGAARVILGTAAVKSPELLDAALSEYGDKIAVGVDARDGFVATDGWLGKTRIDGYELCCALAQKGVKTVIYTDISRDGMMCGANRDIYRRLCKIEGLDVVASGGISSTDELTELRKIGVYAAIVGKALYNGTVSLGEAIAAARGN